jgi:XTP/dITP diphosphohydrolase
VLLRCATTNPGKLREFRLAAELSGHPGIRIEPLGGMRQIPPCPEDAPTFEENAAAKALYYSNYTEDPVFADDSGLAVECLGGEPGVRSARYAGEGAGDAANNRLLLERVKGHPTRAARFVCVIALAHRGRLAATFRGVVEGLIIGEERGANGFGYDPLFFYPPFNRTFAEASAAEKLRVSHRGQALKALLDYCAAAGGV